MMMNSLRFITGHLRHVAGAPRLQSPPCSSPPAPGTGAGVTQQWVRGLVSWFSAKILLYTLLTSEDSAKRCTACFCR